MDKKQLDLYNHNLLILAEVLTMVGGCPRGILKKDLRAIDLLETLARNGIEISKLNVLKMMGAQR